MKKYIEVLVKVYAKYLIIKGQTRFSCSVPSVRELGKQAAERASREQKALDMRDWEEREILRAKLEERDGERWK